jgi:hypothetical protein
MPWKKFRFAASCNARQGLKSVATPPHPAVLGVHTVQAMHDLDKGLSLDGSLPAYTCDQRMVQPHSLLLLYNTGVCACGPYSHKLVFHTQAAGVASTQQGLNSADQLAAGAPAGELCEYNPQKRALTGDLKIDLTQEPSTPARPGPAAFATCQTLLSSMSRRLASVLTLRPSKHLYKQIPGQSQHRPPDAQ